MPAPRSSAARKAPTTTRISSRREIDWIGVPLRDKKPYLGICLGAQMMARHLGGRVYPHPQGHAEVGYYPIRPTPAGRDDLRRLA